MPNNYSYNLDVSDEENYLRALMNGTDPYFSKMKQSAEADINEASTRAKEEDKARLARAGLLKSGIASVSNADLEGKKEQALVKSDAQIGAIEQQAKMQAIQQLLGIKSMEMGNYYNRERLGLSRDQFNWNKNFSERQYEDAQNDKWIAFLDNLLAGAGEAISFIL